MTITLTVEKRTARGKKLKQLRENGSVPGVVYGPKETSTPISIEASAFDKVLKEAGESSIVTLKGLDGDKDVLIHDVSFDVVKGFVEHVDFYAIEAGKEVTTNVPLTFIGEAPALKLGADVSKALYDIEVTCMPKDLPHDIEVDLSVLTGLDSVIHVSDLAIPEGVTVNNDGSEVVASVTEHEEEAEEPAEAVDMDAIEVEQKGKADDTESSGQTDAASEENAA